MSMTPATSPESVRRPSADPADDRRPGPRWGRIVLGLLLTTGGVGWLLDGVSVPVPWNLLPSAGLVVVGVVLLLSLAGGTGRADVVVIGFVLLVAAVAVGAGAGRFAGPVGDRTIVPSTTGWPAPTRISAGTVTVDLTGTALPSTGRLEVAVGAGRVVLRLPAETPVRVHSTVVMGTIVADGVAIGQGVDLDWTAPGTGDAPVAVEIGVGAGEVEVTRERS
ncbi:cell wall-active antibiotics response protein [Pseudonocardia abyssalis]|uniref:Cell wall-active antibiotics response LiaF-like C-terminal domain-containing protein n=1 Tax=Pseudonocardia abyssalis TaxID=2792008 RepID=A0ABS6UNK1_9PSEU|nr:cell wall-active antibiotics response protein [Pseudonocardia abyssalis]MBW0119267.1 hypothetical protein [Pseudonocardia abyssalis]MBW0133836.1 hypothetical protein [Pseudonocardia abyssalis]